MLISKPPTSSEYDLLLRPIASIADVERLLAEHERVRDLPRKSSGTARFTSPRNAATTVPAVADEVPAGFSSPESYAAFKKAEAQGRCSVHGGCQSFPAYKSNR